MTSYLIFMIHIECPSYIKLKVLPDREHSMLPLEVQISSCCVYCENHTEHINTVCVCKYVFSVKPGRTDTNHYPSNSHRYSLKY